MNIKENDTFYYILPRFFTEVIEDKQKEHLNFHVFAYEYHENLKHCFDPKLMFLNKKDAENKCLELNKTKAY